jgi:hypothetical protein
VGVEEGVTPRSAGHVPAVEQEDQAVRRSEAGIFDQ